MMHGTFDYWNLGDWAAMGVLMLVIWGLVTALVVWLVEQSHRERAPAVEPARRIDHAEELLAERFARGEIEDSEFERRRELLHSVPKG